MKQTSLTKSSMFSSVNRACIVQRFARNNHNKLFLNACSSLLATIEGTAEKEHKRKKKKEMNFKNIVNLKTFFFCLSQLFQSLESNSDKPASDNNLDPNGCSFARIALNCFRKPL